MAKCRSILLQDPLIQLVRETGEGIVIVSGAHAARDHVEESDDTHDDQDSQSGVALVKMGPISS